MKRVVLACVLAACGGRSTPPAAPASIAAAPPATAGSDRSPAAAGPVATPARSAADAPECADGSSRCAQLAQFAREMCRCTDAACAGRIGEAMARWGAPPARIAGTERLSDAEAGQIAAIVDRLAACMQRATIKTRTQPPS